MLISDVLKSQNHPRHPRTFFFEAPTSNTHNNNNKLLKFFKKNSFYYPQDVNDNIKNSNDLFFLSQEKNVPKNRHEKRRELPDYYPNIARTSFALLLIHTFLRNDSAKIFSR